MRLRLIAVLLFCSLSAGAQELDLVMTLSGPGNPRPGAERQARIDFHNRDTRAATNVVALVIHDGAQIVDISGAGWLCGEAGRRSMVTCRRNRIEPGETTELNLDVVVSQTSQFGTIRLLPRADQLLPQPNFAPFAINFPAQTTDVALVVSRAQQLEGGRQSIAIAATVVNRGFGNATGLTLRLTGTDYALPRSAAGSGWTCRILGFDAICTRPALGIGENSTVYLSLWASFEHAADVGTLEVIYTGTDVSPADMFAVLRVQATAPPPPDPADFEPVLLPISLLDVNGAFGSVWRTHFTLYNGNDEPLIGRGTFDLAYPFENNCLFPECPNIPSIPARSAASLLIRQRGGAPGVLLWVRKDRAANLDYELRVQDISRQELTWGTEIPVVREKDLRTAPFRLLNVPLDARFRQTLRIYDVSESASAAVQVRYIDADVGRVLHEQVLPLTIASSPPLDLELFSAFRLFPAYAEVGLVASMPELRDSARVHIEVAPLSPELRVWAFVSVTNNETQHVTVISPH